MAAPAQATPGAARRYLQPSVPKFAFFLAMLVTMMRFSYLHEALDLLVGLHYMMLAVMPLALLGMFVSGGLQRTLASPIGVAFLGYVVWLLPCIVFSSWQGGSFAYVKDYTIYHAPFLLLIGGMITNRKELRLFMYAGAIAACIVLVDTRLLGAVDSGGRATMGGSIGNSNDFAALLLFLVPFLAYAACDKKLMTVLRIGAWGGVGYGIYAILSTGSRGALISMMAMGFLIFLRVSMIQKLLVLLIFPPVAFGVLSLLAPSTFARITSTFNSGAAAKDAAAVAEAEASTAVRRYLLQRSLEFTVTKPLFGVGPGQFASYEGGTGKFVSGSRGVYNQTHNTLTQFSSEAGIPALLFILFSMGTSIITMNRIYAYAKRSPENADIASMAFFLMLSAAGLLVATQFLSMAQLFYYPSIAGMGIALGSVWRQVQIQKANGPQPTSGQPTPGQAMQGWSMMGQPTKGRAPLGRPAPQEPRVKFTR